MTEVQPASPYVRLSGVGVRYDTADAWIGDGVDLDVRDDETLLVLGPSGCGKSTLMLTIPGLVPHSAPAELRGTVTVHGEDTVDIAPGRLAAQIGMVFQDPDAQVITETLLDEVCFGLENLQTPVDDIEPRALDALARLGLAGSRAEALRSPQTLSGGGRQRLAIACALALRPRLLVLDEPTANLDPVATAEFYDTLRQVRDGGTGIVLVEHDLDDAIDLADRVVVFDQAGAIIHDGTPEEIIGRQARTLAELGVWLPAATEAALRLGLDTDDTRPLPLTIAELAERMREHPESVTSIATPRREPPTEPAAALLTVDELGVRIGQATLLEDITLTVRRGEFLAVAGANGAGKSTLLRAMTGLIRSSGTVLLGTDPVRGLSARQISDRVGLVFQNPEHQFVTATVRDEVAYGITVRRIPEDEAWARVDALLDRFDLARYADVNPFLLSHGEKRRLSVATAPVTGPELLILVEPT